MGRRRRRHAVEAGVTVAPAVLPVEAPAVAPVEAPVAAPRAGKGIAPEIRFDGPPLYKRPEQVFTCPGCRAEFLIVGNYERHVERHGTA